MKTIAYKLVFILSVISIFTSCSDDDDNPEVINEEETITTVRLTVLESGSTEPQVYTWTESKKDDITLKANSTYNFKIQFLDESNPQDVTDWSTTDAATGILRAFLIHEPTSKAGSSRNDFGGETDIEVDFNITIN